MIELKEYVDGLFRNQPLTPEVKDLKEEILSNMLAKREDLIAQGLDVENATEKAKKSMLTVDSLIDGNQLTGVCQVKCVNYKNPPDRSCRQKQCRQILPKLLLLLIRTL